MALDVEVLEESPPDDGMTIDEKGEPANPIDRPRQLKRISQLDQAEQWRILSRHLLADQDHSREWRSLASYWFGFCAGEQWSEDDKAMLDAKGRPHIVFNRVLTILKAVAGMEINGRHEISYLPTSTEDTAVNEVISQASAWMSDSCDGEDEESQAFDDTAKVGMGWCENRMSWLQNPAGMYREERIDPREMYWDRTATKKNLSNARRLSRVRKMPISEALSMFPGRSRNELDAAWADDGPYGQQIKSIEEKRDRSDNTSPDDMYDDQCEVTIVQIQWIERESYYLVADIATNSKVEMTEEEHSTLAARFSKLGMPLHSVRLVRENYMQAFLGGRGVMLQAALPAPIKGQFSWQCITGEYDPVKKYWFGLVKQLRDPQMWANKWLVQILHILNSTAKGGIFAERTAFDDELEAEQSYAQADEVTWVADGALSKDSPKILPKQGQGFSEGYVGLLEIALRAFRDVSGINLELLGQQDQNQPGILEAMRKQAGMTVLATLFDSLRRFRKLTGRSRLFFIQNYLSDGRLMRIVGDDGTPQAVRLAKEKVAGEYDVIVGDAPTSPNQKEANWAIIQPMMAVFKDQLMANPMLLAMLLEYSPLPSRVVEAFKRLIKQQQEDPQAQQEAQENRALLVQGAMATIDKDKSIALKNQSGAVLDQAKAQGAGADAAYLMAQAQNMIEDNNWQGLKAMAEMKEAEAKAIEATARAERERHGTALDVFKARHDARISERGHGNERVGKMIDHLTAISTVRKDQSVIERNRAAAEKDLAMAALTNRTPAPVSGPPE